MAKSQLDQEGLEQRISEIAQSFVHEIVTVISSATVEELMSLTNGRVLRLSTPALSAMPVKRKRSWPTCGEPGCKNSYYPASGTARLCYKHFLASGGRHPSKKK